MRRRTADCVPAAGLAGPRSQGLVYGVPGSAYPGKPFFVQSMNFKSVFHSAKDVRSDNHVLTRLFLDAFLRSERELLVLAVEEQKLLLG
jgi:hypothetical protein